MFERENIIILKAFPFQESDLILHGLTKRGLLKHFIAKGALKSQKRFPGRVLEPSSFVEVEYRSSSKSLHRLREAWLLNDFPKLRSNYKRLELAFYCLQTIDAIGQDGFHEARELFDLLGNALREAETSSNLQMLKLFFQFRLLFIQGVLPRSLYREELLLRTLKDHEASSFKNLEFSREIDRLVQEYSGLMS